MLTDGSTRSVGPECRSGQDGHSCEELVLVNKQLMEIVHGTVRQPVASKVTLREKGGWRRPR